MIGAHAALLLAGQATAAVPIELDGYFRRAEQLDGRRVEFDAYVYLMGTRNSHPVLSAITGERVRLRSGRTVTACADNVEASVAVRLRGPGLGRLSRRGAQPAGAYAGVRIRGILRNRPFTFHSGNRGGEWGGLVDRATIVRVTGRRCLLNPQAAGEAARMRHSTRRRH